MCCVVIQSCNSIVEDMKTRLTIPGQSWLHNDNCLKKIYDNIVCGSVWYVQCVGYMQTLYYFI